MRQSDEVERDADKRSVNDVDGHLEKEIPGDAPAGISHGLGHAREVAIAGEVDEAVTQVFPLQQYKKGEDNGEQSGGKGLNDTAEFIEAPGGAADFAYLNRVLGAGAKGLGRGFTGRTGWLRWSWRCRVRC